MRAPIVRFDRRVLFAIGCAALVLVEGYVLFARQAGPPLVVEGRKTRVVTELGAGARLAQTFVPAAEFLDGVTVRFRSASRATVELTCELLAGENERFVPLFRWTERIDVRGSRPHTLRFPPVVPSQGRPLRLDLQLTRAPARGLAIVASEDNAVQPGTLSIDGVDQWGDLVFETRSATPYRLFRLRMRGLPPVLREPVVHVATLALYNWALLTFAYFMLVARREGA